MSRSGRRDFLKSGGAGLAGAATLGWPHSSPGAEDIQAATEALAPHRPLQPPGVHAYADRISAAAGETIAFHVSSTVPYRLSVCRLGLEVDDPNGDRILHEFPQSAPCPQPIHPGSYLHVAHGLDPNEILKALTLECWVRPWRLNAWAGLVGQHDYPHACGYGLFLNPDGGISFYLGDGGTYRGPWSHASPGKAIGHGQWTHVVGVWDGRYKSIWINGQPAGRWAHDAKAAPGGSTLRLAAYGERGLTDHFLDGDLAMTVIHDRALTESEIRDRFHEEGLHAPVTTGVRACWTFAEERGEKVNDHAGQGFDARIVNHATWMIGGPSFDAGVERFGSYDPKTDARRGHGLRFASDDLYDCRWPIAHRFKIPADARSGFYVGRIHYELGGKPHLYHVTFIVNKARGAPKAPIALLAATNTWLAYSATPFAPPFSNLKNACGTQGFADAPDGLPAYSLYRAHAAGQGSYQLGLRMPRPAAGPYVLYGAATDYSHLARADRFMQVWLEKSGYDYDLITDLDLHRDPDLIRGYKTFIINGHGEYWSPAMYHGLENHLDRGGKVICLSGNSIFWRVSFDDDATVMECRKADAPGWQVPADRRGEAWHAHDGLRGGLTCECGYPSWKLVGLETLGWINHNLERHFDSYAVEAPDHFLFNEPNRLNLAKGDVFGEAPDGGLPRANGHEVDVRLSTLRAIQRHPTPAGAVLPDDPEGIELLAAGHNWPHDATTLDYFFNPGQWDGNLGGEMIYWQRPGGGTVFNAGSIGAGWAIHADPRFQLLMRNVLHHFGVPMNA